LLGAAACFALGGLAMQWSRGLTEVRATVMVYLAFAAGATLQARGMQGEAMSVVYTAVLGLEAVLAVMLGRWVLGDVLTTVQSMGVVLVVVGTAMLRWPR
jgi:multidrug transporter EmrE-like cation transporter